MTRLTERDLKKMRREIRRKETLWRARQDDEDLEMELLTITEAQVAILDWLASIGHKVEYA